MTSSPTTLWQIDGTTMETMRDFILWGSKITADGNCHHEIKWHLFLGRKVMTNLDSTLKSRDITLLTKVHLVKAMVYPVVFCGCERWTIKIAEHQRIDALNCGIGEDSWASLGLQGDPTSSLYRKSVLNIHWKDWCWNWNSNTLATWFEELTHLKISWCWERLKGEGDGDDREWDGWMASPGWWTWVWASSWRWWWTAKPGVLHAVHGVTKSVTWLTNWTELMMLPVVCHQFSSFTQSCLTLCYIWPKNK